MEARLVGQERIGQPVDLLGGERHRPLGIEIGVEGAPGGHAVDHLDAADLDHPVAALGIEPGGFGVEHDLAHRRDYRAPRRRLARAQAVQRRKACPPAAPPRARVSASDGAGVDHVVGARALFGVGQLQREDLRELLRRSCRAGRARARAARLGGAETTSTASTSLAPPFSNSSGMSNTTSVAPACSRRKSCARRAHRRMDDRFQPRRALRDRRTPPRRAWPGRRPSGPVVPGKAASIAGSSAPPGPCKRCTAASASNTGTPSASNIAATVDLPMPIEPVRPRTNGPAS